MSVGIGGGGFVGVALEQLDPPVQLAGSSATVGGTLPTASTYRYYVTAINALGETTVSNEITIGPTGAGATNANTVNWTALPGATGYRIYRTLAGGISGSELFLAAVGVVTTYIDTGALVPAGALPAMNSAAAPNTYKAPTKFFPITSESLKYKQDTQWRRPIRQNVDNLGGVPGNVNIEGDIEMEALVDAMVYFHAVSRASCVRTGPVSSLYTYTYTPTPAATAAKTMSITIVRNGQVFGYTGCVLGTFKYAMDNGLLKATYTIIGSDEASQTLPVSTYVNQLQPFGAGEYAVEIPTATQVFDMDTFEFSVEDNASAEFRMKNTGRGAQFVKFGERNVTLTCERDFETRADYDAYKALTAQNITIKAAKATLESVEINLVSAIKDTYDLSLSSQGDLVRGSVAYQGVWNEGAQKAYGLVIKSLEVLAP